MEQIHELRNPSAMVKFIPYGRKKFLVAIEVFVWIPSDVRVVRTFVCKYDKVRNHYLVMIGAVLSDKKTNGEKYSYKSFNIYPEIPIDVFDATDIPKFEIVVSAYSQNNGRYNHSTTYLEEGNMNIIKYKNPIASLIWQKDKKSGNYKIFFETLSWVPENTYYVSENIINIDEQGRVRPNYRRIELTINENVSGSKVFVYNSKLIEGDQPTIFISANHRAPFSNIFTTEIILDYNENGVRVPKRKTKVISGSGSGGPKDWIKFLTNIP